MWIIDETDTFLRIWWKITGQCIFYAFDNCRLSTTILAKNQCQRCGKCDFLKSKIKFITITRMTLFVGGRFINRVDQWTNGYQITQSECFCIDKIYFFCAFHTCSSSASTPKLRMPRTVSLSSIDILTSNEILWKFQPKICRFIFIFYCFGKKSKSNVPNDV